MVTTDEVFYKICFDSLLEGLCIVNQEGRIVMNNLAVEEIFGYEKDELKGQKIDMLIPESHRSLHLKYFNSYLKSPTKHKKGRGRDIIGRHKNGSILELEIGLNYFVHEGVFYAKALISDISARKQKELMIRKKNRNLELEVEERTEQLMRVVLELEKSNLNLKEEIKERIMAENRAKLAFEKEKELNIMQTKFMSLASHEFKTPLSGILTSAGLIEKYNQLVLNKNINSHVIKIKTLVNQLNSILDDFLFLENTESNKNPMDLSKFNFCDLMKKLVNDATAILKEGQRILIQPCTLKKEIYQDRKVLDIMIRNVLYNAIKYSGTDSVILINVENGESLKISIKDQGIGIPKEAQKYVFERFYRAKNALHITGTGIGLNIVKAHLEKLNGSIELESEEHKGTTVTIELPLIHNESKVSNVLD